MIESSFRSLEREKVAYLLISGQAAVLHGAAVFSEDIDLWISPTADNARAMLSALASVSATYDKLTPPFEVPYMASGHEFHFRLPGEPEVYLDVTGQPPRVPGFDAALAAATVMSTAWGEIPTIGVRHLVALKSTQRLGDYPIISQLVLRYIESLKAPRAADFGWSFENLHTMDELEELLRGHPEAAEQCEPPALRKLAAETGRGGDTDDPTRIEVERWLAERILLRRQADREYWQPVMAELRELRASGGLVAVGAPVTPR